MFAHLREFADRPFNPEMNMWGWALFIVFILIVAGLWVSTLNLLKEL